MFCQNCGKKIEGGDLFCPFCGAKQQQVNPSENAGVRSMPVRKSSPERGWALP